MHAVVRELVTITIGTLIWIALLSAFIAVLNALGVTVF